MERLQTWHWPVAQVLMHAGPEGFMVRDIIRKAAEMRIADWDSSKGKKSHISGCISKENRFVHVGGWKCAYFVL